MDRLGTTRTSNPGSRTNEEQQGHYTHGDATEQFKAAMLEAGITPPDDIIGDGQLHRFKIDGKLNGAYVLHLNGRPAGYFQDFKQGIKQNWKLEGNFMPLSDFQRRAFKAQCKREAEQRQAEVVAKYKATAIKAVFIWTNAKPAPANHSYLTKKCIRPHGIRLDRDNTLIIPIYNDSKKLVNLQFISETGSKRFLSGGKKKGCFSVIGKPDAGDPILICEGFATGASLHEATGHFVVIALDAGNLESVARVFRKLYPLSEIIIAGDNDESGTGQKAARVAALAIGGKYILPKTVGHDWNDSLTMAVV